MNLAAFAWRNVFRNRRRTTITAGIFCIGTISILLTSGFVFSTFFGLRELTISSEFGHIQVAARGAFEGNEAKALQSGLSTNQLSQILSIASNHEAVRFAMPRIHFDGLISNGEQTVAVRAQGVDGAKESKLSSLFIPIVKGEGYPVQPAEGPSQIMLASGLADHLGAQPGSTVTLLANTPDGALNALDLLVAGIYSTGVPEMDQRAVMLPIETAQQLLRSDRVSRVVVALTGSELTDKVASEMKARLSGFEVKTWSDLAHFYRRVVQLYANVFTVFGLILLAVILLSAVNSMTMNVTERIKETGTFRAFGISSAQVRRSFMLEGAMVGLIGGIVGLVAGTALAIAINMLQIAMPPPPGRNLSYPLFIMLRADVSVALVTGMAVLGGLSAWLPARRAARIRVVEALNHV